MVPTPCSLAEAGSEVGILPQAKRPAFEPGVFCATGARSRAKRSARSWAGRLLA